MRISGKVAAMVVLCVALGCGGESDSGDGGGGSGAGDPSGPVDTGLPESTPLESVTPEQYADACEALRDSVEARLGPDRAVRGVCEVYSGALTDDPAQCRSSADTCVTQVNGGTHPLGISRQQLDFTMFECGDTGQLEGCSVTVGEFETCLEDRMSGIEALMEGNDCSNAASVNLTTAMALLDIGGMSPASCARVEQECPGVGPTFMPQDP